jgi:hypothetical protein
MWGFEYTGVNSTDNASSFGGSPRVHDDLVGLVIILQIMGRLAG